MMNRLQNRHQHPSRDIALRVNCGVPRVHVQRLEILRGHSGSQDGERFYSTNVAPGVSANRLLIANQMSPSCFAIRGLKHG
jgi:hypothetical protein